jgi:hypothetical protein
MRSILQDLQANFVSREPTGFLNKSNLTLEKLAESSVEQSKTMSGENKESIDVLVQEMSKFRVE